MTASTDISFVLTSCGRFDLLAETISTFLAWNSAPIGRYVIVEDSGDERIRDVLTPFGNRFELLFNDPRLGQMQSIDRAYAGLQTPYIFHCEDDWRFFRGGFIEESLLLLQHFPSISAVLCRRAGQNRVHDMVASSTRVSRLREVEFRQSRLDVSPIWGGYSFNPGLRRLADYRRLGSFAGCGHEDEVSRWFKQQGMGVASLERPACETTGRGRHVLDVFAPAASNRALGTQPPRNAACPCGSGRRYKHCHGSAG
ncbi:MAG: SEC-C metal-binding domain-containing protein [Casimicrobiaceae bacterium]